MRIPLPACCNDSLKYLTLLWPSLWPHDLEYKFWQWDNTTSMGRIRPVTSASYCVTYSADIGSKVSHIRLCNNLKIPFTGFQDIVLGNFSTALPTNRRITQKMSPPICSYKLVVKEIVNSKKRTQILQESPANAKGTRNSSACMKAHCEQM